jgi:hypothetical protein
MVMEAKISSKNMYQTIRRNNPEDRNLHTRRREDFEFHKFLVPLYIPVHIKLRTFNENEFFLENIVIFRWFCLVFILPTVSES